MYRPELGSSVIFENIREYSGIFGNIQEDPRRNIWRPFEAKFSFSIVADMLMLKVIDWSIQTCFKVKAFSA